MFRLAARGNPSSVVSVSGGCPNWVEPVEVDGEKDVRLSIPARRVAILPPWNDLRWTSLPDTGSGDVRPQFRCRPVSSAGTAIATETK